MSSYKTAFPSRYFKPEDLGTVRPIVTIASVEFVDIGVGADVQRKLLVEFDSASTTFAASVNARDRARVTEALKTKGWVLNRINSETIAEIAGSDDFDEWGGHQIELFATKTEFQGKRVACTRCQAPKGKKGTSPQAAPPLAEDDANDDSVPF